MGTTPLILWAQFQVGKKEATVSQASLTTTLAESRRHFVDKTLRNTPQTNFERKAWMQSDKKIGAWLWACPRGELTLNAIQFSVVAQTYFGVQQRCLEGLVGQPIIQKSGGNTPNRQTSCDAIGENLVKATLLGSRWTYHHNTINL